MNYKPKFCSSPLFFVCYIVKGLLCNLYVLAFVLASFKPVTPYKTAVYNYVSPYFIGFCLANVSHSQLFYVVSALHLCLNVIINFGCLDLLQILRKPTALSLGVLYIQYSPKNYAHARTSFYVRKLATSYGYLGDVGAKI